jgi:hypothetical protein
MKMDVVYSSLLLVKQEILPDIIKELEVFEGERQIFVTTTASFFN